MKRLLGVMGDPIAHSVSPAIHTAAIEALGLDYEYLPFRVTPERVGDAVRGMRALDIRGMNVTVPHKERVIEFLDKLTPRSEATGSVNTIINDNGVLIGDTTDGEGFLRDFEMIFGPVRGKRALLLGAGGAARSVAYSLAAAGCGITIVNRTSEKAESIKSMLRRSFDDIFVEIGYNISDSVNNSDFVINTTSVGMIHPEETPLEGSYLRKDLGVYDIIYNPPRTRLMREAESVGAATANGLGMLVNQAALSFVSWTGKRPPLELMFEAASIALF
ncbi:MAG: shikimate dehydrogenase [Abditibacteriota bacterium]|nr:shikimate dehydrogenase [Abditibacteriota bacterium]MBP5738540.1 shikimate dehydrogenase [Abditibacteriota bacterium]